MTDEVEIGVVGGAWCMRRYKWGWWVGLGVYDSCNSSLP